VASSERAFVVEVSVTASYCAGRERRCLSTKSISRATEVGVSTRMLIVLAALCGLLILAAFAVQITLAR
jgi:hypothetical protein